VFIFSSTETASSAWNQLRTSGPLSHVAKAQFVAQAFELGEFIGGHIADDGQAAARNPIGDTLDIRMPS
jgi:hypothetical protein